MKYTELKQKLIKEFNQEIQEWESGSQEEWLELALDQVRQATIEEMTTKVGELIDNSKRSVIANPIEIKRDRGVLKELEVLGERLNHLTRTMIYRSPKGEQEGEK